VRYAGAAVGPIGVAGAQFLLSLLLLRQLDVADFGRFAFLLVISQFSISLWSALFTAPLLIAVGQKGADDDAAAPRALLCVSSLALLPVALAFVGLAWMLGAGMGAACVFGLWGGLALLRHFARAWYLVHRAPARTIASDVGYSLALLLGALMMMGGAARTSLADAALLLLVSAGFGLLPFARSKALATVRAMRLSDMTGYQQIWRRDARWSLLGVVTTEATVNSQSYIVTALSGAGGFAPIAATALLIRPVTVAINALTEFERARFVHDLRSGSLMLVERGRAQLRWALLGIWGVTLVSALALLALAPALVFHGKFADTILWTGVLLWFVVVLARAFHACDGAVLLASGRFRKLAQLSSMSAIVSVMAVVALQLLLGPVWSIGGIALGESLYALLLFRAARTEMRNRAKEPGCIFDSSMAR
jgi:hypothetical protein